MGAKGIEGIPVIIRFKTKDMNPVTKVFSESIEGIPVIIRFKTSNVVSGSFFHLNVCIEGIPVIIRFKTSR